MWSYEYGEFSDSQISEVKNWMRKQIFFLLLLADPTTKNNYVEINIYDAFESLLMKIGGVNQLLGCPSQLVMVMGLLKAAISEYASPEYDEKNFRCSKYRQCILEAGNEVLKIKEV